MSPRICLAGLMSLVGLLPLAPADAAGPERLRVGLCDFTPASGNDAMETHLDFIADRFAVVVRGAPYEIDVPRLRALNPGILVLAYWNTLFTGFEGCAPPEPPLTPDMFMADLVTGDRMVSEDPLFGASWFMEPGSSGWQQHSTDEILDILDIGYDGVHLDDIWADMLAVGRVVPTRYDSSCVNRGPYDEVPEWYDRADFQRRVHDLIAHVREEVSPGLVFFNGLNELPLVEERGYLDVADGASMEASVYAELFWPDEPFRTGEAWRLIMETYIGVPDDQLIGWVNFGEPAAIEGRMYALASYLLGANATSTLYFTPDCSVLAWFPEWDLPLEVPNQRPSSLELLFDGTTGVYHRELGNGLVLVDPRPDGEPQTLELDRTLCRVVPQGGMVAQLGGDGLVRLDPVTEVTLGPHQGVVLLDPPCAAPRRPSGRVRP